MAGPLQSPLRIFNILVVHLLLAHFCRGQFQLTGPPRPIVATLGDDIILPCHLVPGTDVAGKTLEWTRPELDPRYVFVWRAGQDHVNLKNPSYKGRTSLYTGELQHGNISLKLSNVKPSDGGRYKCYVPDLNTESFVELVVGSRVDSWPTISLSGLDRNKGAVVLQCESTGWYPEPEVFWLDGEGNLLSAGPTETVRGPDDLYTVSSRVTVEKRHSNSFTYRVQQNSTNQIREAKIHVPDDFFEVQSSYYSTTVGLAVSLAVCILVILILGFLVWNWRQQIFKTKRGHRDEQVVTVEETESQQLLTHETVQMKDLNKGQAAGIRPEEEQHMRKVAEKLQELLKEELENKKTEIRKKQSDLQQLDEEKKKKEEKVKRLKEHLENKNTESSKNKDKQKKKKKKEDGNELDTLKQQLDTHQTELDSKTKEFDDKRVEVQQLQEDIQKMETNLETLMEELQSNNKEFKWSQESKEEQQSREEAENRVQILEEELQKNNRELQEEKKRREEEVQRKNQELQEKTDQLQEEHDRRDKAEKGVLKKDKELQDKTEQKQNSSSLSQNSTRKTVVVFRVDPHGKYIQLRNRSTEDQQLGGWDLKIQVNDKEPIKHTFEDSFNLKTGKPFTVWCRGYGSHYPPTDLVLNYLKLLSRTDKLQVSLISHPGEIQYNLDRITER